MSMNDKANLKVFISYAREDTQAANRLYNDLKLTGFDPWLDTESLLAGQNWRIAIRDAIKKSRYFIALLSSNSVEKIGHVQRELKEALEVLGDFPQSKIFLIPVRLDESKINDEKLREIHIVDLFPDWKQGFQKMLKSMGVEGMTTNKSDKESPLYQYDEGTELLRYIDEKKCSPFIGPEAHVRWIPNNNNIAIKWAEEHGYPFEDRRELPQVAQFLAITKADEMYPKKYLSKILKSIPVPDFSLPEYENTVYSVLADLNLPIYITTNYDHLMENALISKGKDPQSEFCRWNKTVIEYARRAEISFISDNQDYVPSPATPLVFHLHGDMDQPRSMVLTEQDYLNFIFNMSNLDSNPIFLPSILRKSFATSAQIFLGFSLNDMNSRILFRSIAVFLSTIEPPYSVAIMPQPPVTDSGYENVAQTRNYLTEFARDMFKLNIQWADPFIYTIELRNSFNRFRKETLSTK